MYYGTYPTADPHADFARWEAEQQKKLNKLPTCCECGEPIQDEECYEINGELICPKCLKENHLKFTDDYIND